MKIYLETDRSSEERYFISVSFANYVHLIYEVVNIGTMLYFESIRVNHLVF